LLFSKRNNVFLLDTKNIEWLSLLPEEVKLRNLSERILEAARNERNGLLIIPMGVFLVSAGLIISVAGNNTIAYLGGGISMMLGLISTIFGFYVTAHYAHQYNNLLEELDTLSR